MKFKKGRKNAVLFALLIDQWVEPAFRGAHSCVVNCELKCSGESVD